MARMILRHLLRTTVAAGGLVLVAAACGSSSSSGSAATSATTAAASTAAPTTATTTAPTTVAPTSAAPTSAAPTSAAAGGTTLAVANTNLGPVIVDGQGFTLYLFTKDQGTTSVCYKRCATEWPATVVTGTPTIGSGLDKSLLGTTKRTDGKTQVTYGGHPLYRFAPDKAPGDTNGQNVLGIWFVVGANGNKM
jgi:predicted lipoprotein with Yx(FWY)xxD motif